VTSCGPRDHLACQDQDKPSALRHPLTASRPDDALSAHVPSGDFLHAQAHGAVVLKDEIRNHSSYDAPTRSNSDPGRARLLKLKPPPLKSKEARSSAVMREHGEHFVSSSTLSLKNMKISNLKEYDVTLPERGSCFKNVCCSSVARVRGMSGSCLQIMYRSKLEEDASYDIALLEQLGSEGPVHVDLKPVDLALMALCWRVTSRTESCSAAGRSELQDRLEIHSQRWGCQRCCKDKPAKYPRRRQGPALGLLRRVEAPIHCAIRNSHS